MLAAVGKWLWRGFGVLIVVIGVMWIFGPYEPVDTEISLDSNDLPPDLDGYLAASEFDVPGLVPGVEKRIIWAGTPGAQTDLSVVYLHGFSGTSEEIRPVPDDVARSLGANLFYARLTGHGQDGAALAAATAGDWIEDTAEALAIGRRIGREVLVISTSTGGTLAALAAVNPDLYQGVKGIVFVSPNFALVNPAASLLTLPAARYWVPLVAGRERSFSTQNAGHEAYWTNSYPTVAVLPMAALLQHTAGQDFRAARVPALFLFSEQDQVVDPAVTRAVATVWGASKVIAPQELTPGDDPYNHVIAGDILSPGMTESVTAQILDWASGL